MRNSTAVRLAAVLALAAAIGSTWQRSEPAHADGSVSIASFAFAPGLVAVDEGDIVTWTNNDSVIHSVAFTTGPSSPILNPGQDFTRSFETAGTFVYQCGVHPSMSGSVTVAAAQAPTATSTPTAGPPTITPTNTTAPQASTATPTPTPTPASGGGEDPTASATSGGDATDTPTAAGSTPTATDQTGTPAPTGTPGNGDQGTEDDDDGGSNTGLVVGVVIAVLAGVALAAVGIAMRRRGA